jgi:hypothetical protein
MKWERRETGGRGGCRRRRISKKKHYNRFQHDANGCEEAS